MKASSLASRPASSAGKAKTSDSYCQSMETESRDSCTDSTGDRSGPRPYGGYKPGRGPVSRKVETVTLLSGEQVYRGTRAHPILMFEKCKAENNSHAMKLKIWCTEHIEHERQRMQEKAKLETITTPQLSQLQHLPDWAASKWEGLLGRPWAYMDAPSGHPTVGVASEHQMARLTVAVLVRLDREEQYLPGQNVAKLVSEDAMQVHKTRVFIDDGSLLEDKKIMHFLW